MSGLVIPCQRTRLRGYLSKPQMVFSALLLHNSYHGFHRHSLCNLYIPLWRQILISQTTGTGRGQKNPREEASTDPDPTQSNLAPRLSI